MPLASAFTLPLESDFDKELTYADVILINVEPEDRKSAKLLFEGQPMIQDAGYKSKSRKFSRTKFVFVMIQWHFLIYLILTSSFYAIFHYGFKTDQKTVILKAFSFCDDWRQIAFFLGIYISFAVKKVQDVISVNFML